MNSQSKNPTDYKPDILQKPHYLTVIGLFSIPA